MIEINISKLPSPVQLVARSIEDIEEKYYNPKIAKLVDGELLIEEGVRGFERNFSSRIIQSVERSFTNANIHKDLSYEIEIVKSLIFRDQKRIKKYEQTFNKLYASEMEKDEEFYTIPDIVIHGGEKDFTKENQIFISEVKTAPTLSQRLFNIDWFKLNVYIEELHFQNSALIILNKSFEEIEVMAKNYVANKYYNSERKGLYILVKPNFRTTLKIFRIK